MTKKRKNAKNVGTVTAETLEDVQTDTLEIVDIVDDGAESMSFQTDAEEEVVLAADELSNEDGSEVIQADPVEQLPEEIAEPGTGEADEVEVELTPKEVGIETDEEEEKKAEPEAPTETPAPARMLLRPSDIDPTADKALLDVMKIPASVRFGTVGQYVKDPAQADGIKRDTLGRKVPAFVRREREVCAIDEITRINRSRWAEQAREACRQLEAKKGKALEEKEIAKSIERFAPPSWKLPKASKAQWARVFETIKSTYQGGTVAPAAIAAAATTTTAPGT